MNPWLFIGMISGTSRDGVDAALVSFKGDKPEVRQAVCLPYPRGLAQELNRLVTSGQRPGKGVREELDARLADHFCDTVMHLLQKAAVNEREITAIGSHGQTVWHDPDGPNPESVQLGDPARIAQKTGILTVGDFRLADIEAGGQGAPLAPLLHRALFQPSSDSAMLARVVLNLGGIANISVISRDGDVAGYDTGPANCLMDAWVGLHRGEAFDRDGRWAAGGKILTHLLEAFLADPYFQRPAPKSTGIEYFNMAWLQRFRLDSQFDVCDVQTTLAELTAVSVADAIRLHSPGDVLVCGGGAHNRYLIRRLQALMPDVPVRSTADHGLDPDWVEAVLFAWLARERLAEKELDTRGITGARHKVLLGKIAVPH